MCEGEDSNDERKERTRLVVLYKPVSLEAESDAADYRAPNPLQLFLSLIKDLRPGADLSRLHIPPHFNMPKSQLQVYGEMVYSSNVNMLSKCNNGESPVERLISVVAWNLSTLRPLVLGGTPFNPILGETHHVSRGTLNVLLEQISHHPPVTALHATDENENIEMKWCHYHSTKFYGTSVEVDVCGKRQLKLMKHGETYEMNSPKLMFKFFPSPSAEWGGNVRVHCIENDLKAELCYRGLSFLGHKGNNRSVKGKIFHASLPNPSNLYEISGHWDRTVSLKDMKDGTVRELYDAKEVISGLKAPIVEDPMGVWPSESGVVWSEVSQGILGNDWEKARKTKRGVEEKQRELARERESRKERWVPKHFTVFHTQETGWDCVPIQSSVPPSPVVVPL